MKIHSREILFKSRKMFFFYGGNAIPDRFANPGISGLSLLNPGINPADPGIELSHIMAG